MPFAEFPKMLYRLANGQIETRVVDTAEQEAAAADAGWTPTRADVADEDGNPLPPAPAKAAKKA